jgi:hypothetical protein
MTKFYTMREHDEALMLCAHWATPENEKNAISYFAACISMNERPEPSDAAVFEARKAEWERNSVITWYVADAKKEPISPDFANYDKARTHKTDIGGTYLMWRQSYPRSETGELK